MSQRRYTEAVVPLERCKSLSESAALTRSSDQAAHERKTDEDIQEPRRSVERIRGGDLKGLGEMTVTKIEAEIRRLEAPRRS